MTIREQKLIDLLFEIADEFVDNNYATQAEMEDWVRYELKNKGFTVVPCSISRGLLVDDEIPLNLDKRTLS